MKKYFSGFCLLVVICLNAQSIQASAMQILNVEAKSAGQAIIVTVQTDTSNNPPFVKIEDLSSTSAKDVAHKSTADISEGTNYFFVFDIMDGVKGFTNGEYMVYAYIDELSNPSDRERVVVNYANNPTINTFNVVPLQNSLEISYTSSVPVVLVGTIRGNGIEKKINVPMYDSCHIIKPNEYPSANDQKMLVNGLASGAEYNYNFTAYRTDSTEGDLRVVNFPAHLNSSGSLRTLAPSLAFDDADGKIIDVQLRPSPLNTKIIWYSNVKPDKAYVEVYLKPIPENRVIIREDTNVKIQDTLITVTFSPTELSKALNQQIKESKLSIDEQIPVFRLGMEKKSGDLTETATRAVRFAYALPDKDDPEVKQLMAKDENTKKQVESLLELAVEIGKNINNTNGDVIREGGGPFGKNKINWIATAISTGLKLVAAL